MCPFTSVKFPLHEPEQKVNHIVHNNILINLIFSSVIFYFQKLMLNTGYETPICPRGKFSYIPFALIHDPYFYKQV